mmetsp:Transcript_21702/g.47678  ORF Transcript_21702/g.47678 Transcript_21702/m.47678 type:complete len:262 (-) Transcript_21702:324-1109(-)|eukprot:CAMPEP_0118939792 /NCGR_PEP_ID=MMETSP1169-20130426/29830_1 /TAXON_ID=36882 /ORGANISM="Pyramimonas obovata, Strain CCMP722" /LENGTH=261 /DNA_ID=CAMNT_0006884131 /DNA_START=62 /DNA_END=847 /DNA_ORIENTATION=+
MELFPTSSGEQLQLAGCTLVVPAVSTANVGQLAVDLLISTLELPRVAYLEHDAVLPCVGNDPYVAPCGAVATSMELYADASKSLVVMQQRSPVTPGKQREFAADLATWAERCKFKEVVVLSGLSAKWRTEQRIGLGFQLCYIASTAGTADGAHPRCEEIGLPRLADEEFGPEARQELRLPPWPLFEALKGSDGGNDVVTFLAFCNEGDNIPDAAAMAQLTAHYLNLLPETPAGQDRPASLQWRMPPSWAHLYGPPPEVGLF